MFQKHFRVSLDPNVIVSKNTFKIVFGNILLNEKFNGKKQ